ncbi:MAG: hypothetical protein NC311_01125 [Muribaculaceae bacterium]|nr:hypothetical protein [Muribaculaceae bacterium]
MAKVLQIRRGTTAQNDNFTGLAGEITFDTEKNTLRVHDGIRLGGYPVATPTDDATGGNCQSFDIESVSDEFWQSLFGRMMQNVIRTVDSQPMRFGGGAFIEYIFSDIPSNPAHAMPILVCINADAGYAVGDTVYAFGVGDHPVMVPNLITDKNGVHVKLPTAGGDFWVYNKSTCAKTVASSDNWRIKFRLYY